MGEKNIDKHVVHESSEENDHGVSVCTLCLIWSGSKALNSFVVVSTLYRIEEGVYLYNNHASDKYH